MIVARWIPWMRGFSKEDRGDPERVSLGALKPVDLADGSGMTARLANLGFLAPEDRGAPDEVARALAELQAAANLPATGVPDATTLEALRRAHDLE
jgi:hypothetical protein